MSIINIIKTTFFSKIPLKKMCYSLKTSTKIQRLTISNYSNYNVNYIFQAWQFLNYHLVLLEILQNIQFNSQYISIIEIYQQIFKTTTNRYSFIISNYIIIYKQRNEQSTTSTINNVHFSAQKKELFGENDFLIFFQINNFLIQYF